VVFGVFNFNQSGEYLMDNLIFVGGSIVFALVIIVALALLLAKLYQRASKEVAFVRTGAGGSKVIKDGGALVVPILHDITKVNMNTLRLDVKKKEAEALITFDRMRVDVGVEFYVRVKQTDEAIATAAQTLGSKTMNPGELSALVEGKFVDALRSVASSMTMKDLHEQRTNFVTSVQKAVTSDLEKNGLELEFVSLTSFDQTNRKFFNPDNAFDVEGLTRLTEQIEQRKKLRNDIEKDTELQIAQKNLETEKQQMGVRQDLAKSKAETDQLIAFQHAQQQSEISKYEAERTFEAETAKIEADKRTQQARISKDREIRSAEIEVEKEIQQKNIAKDQALREATISQEKSVNLAEQDKLIVLAKKSQEQAAAQASAENARAEQVKATQEVMTIEAVATADRNQQIEVINAQAAAKKESVKIVVAAEAEAADKRATALLTVSKTESEAEVLRAAGVKAKYEAEAEGQTKLNDAANKQSPEVIAMLVKMRMIEMLPEIIRESVKPMENIDRISIVDMGGLSGLVNGSSTGGNGGDGTPHNPKSLPDQVVEAGLRHRASAPLIDSLLASVGITDGDVSKAVSDTLQLGKR
jgi:uncharacterized membrane protein YqiK